MFECLQRHFKAILEWRLPFADGLHETAELFDMFARVPSHLGEDFGSLVLGRDDPQLGDGVQVEELLDESGEKFDGAAKAGRLQVLESIDKSFTSVFLKKFSLL